MAGTSFNSLILLNACTVLTMTQTEAVFILGRTKMLKVFYGYFRHIFKDVAKN